MSSNQQQVLDNFKALAPNIKVLSEETLTLLGAPVLPESENHVLQKKLDDLARMSGRLEELDVHDALFLLKNCFSIPRLTYFLRCAPCYRNKEMLQQYDLLINKTLKKFLNVDLKRMHGSRVVSQCRKEAWALEELRILQCLLLLLQPTELLWGCKAFCPPECLI